MGPTTQVLKPHVEYEPTAVEWFLGFGSPHLFVISFSAYSMNMTSTIQMFNEDDIQRIESIQLSTTAHHQGFIDNIADGLWSWFELVILEWAGATEPRLTADNKPMTFFSHSIPAYAAIDQDQQGNILERGQELLSYLEVLHLAFFEYSC